MNMVRVSGQSMTPVLQSGDEVLVDWSRGPFKTGDIVIYRAEDSTEWIIHRVVRRSGRRYAIKGDASPVTEWVDRQRIWGVVRSTASSYGTSDVTRFSRTIALLSGLGLRKAVVALGLFSKSDKISGDEAERSELSSLDASTEHVRVALREFELDEVLATLTAEKIPVILLKGIDLAYRVYDSPTHRPMGDIDILVRPEHYARAKALLTQINYPKTELEFNHSFRGAHASPLRSVSIDLHFQGLANQNPDEIQSWWNRAQASPRHSRFSDVYVLDSTDLLIYVIEHAGVQHLFEDAFWFRDVAQIIKNQKIDWSRFCGQVIEKSICAATLVMLETAASEYDASVPDHVLERLSRQLSPSHRQKLFGVSYTTYWTLQHHRPFSWLTRHRILVRDNWREVVRYSFDRYLRLFREKILNR